eukprot:GGOE01025145.1.p1 GENE.GGOE01025145.1~~GGOE01025145.1.p1  ORF type:complete len:162 (+),score=7.93 GGOE01025145.1:2043-2528(+)
MYAHAHVPRKHQPCVPSTSPIFSSSPHRGVWSVSASIIPSSKGAVVSTFLRPLQSPKSATGNCQPTGQRCFVAATLRHLMVLFLYSIYSLSPSPVTHPRFPAPAQCTVPHAAGAPSIPLLNCSPSSSSYSCHVPVAELFDTLLTLAMLRPTVPLADLDGLW